VVDDDGYVSFVSPAAYNGNSYRFRRHRAALLRRGRHPRVRHGPRRRPTSSARLSQPFSASSCSSPTANEVDSGIIASHSPASYNTGSCYNGYIVDVTDWDTDNATTIYQEWRDGRSCHCSSASARRDPSFPARELIVALRP
jgi:hypothetical protein